MNHLMEPTRTIYDNFNVYSPNGELMFKTNKRKLNWYLRKDLADIISNEPLSIKLKFKPKGLDLYGNELEDIKNICCGCGIDKNLTLHHVFPHCYKKYLPLEYKTHDHSNVLCLCRECHNQYEIKADKVKRELIDNIIPYQQRVKESVVRNLAKTYYNYYEMIPDKSRETIITKISNFLNKEVTDDDIIDILSKPDIDPNKIVVDNLTNIEEFIEFWKKHFIENMNIVYLPKHFKYDKNILQS